MELLRYLQASPAAFALTCAALGLVVGSFLNVVIYRLPVVLERGWRRDCAELSGEPAADEGEPFNLVVPRSRCPSCGHTVRAHENVPVLSYLALRGRCSACGWRIPLRYPAVELLTGVLSAAVAWRFGFGLPAVAALPLTWALVALAFIDLDTQLLPDGITLPFLWLGLLLNLVPTFAPLPAAVLGAASGYLVLWTVYQAFRVITGKEGMGYGDFKLLAMLGAWLGWSALPAVILISSAVGATVGLALILGRGHDRSVPIPFGPYLAAGGWIALMWGHDLTAAYLRASGMG